MNPFIDYVKTTGYRPLAEQIGVSYQAVQQWAARGYPPATRCLAIEALTGIPRHELRPDIYPPPTPRRKRQQKAPCCNNAALAEIKVSNDPTI